MYKCYVAKQTPSSLLPFVILPFLTLLGPVPLDHVPKYHQALLIKKKIFFTQAGYTLFHHNHVKYRYL